MKEGFDMERVLELTIRVHKNDFEVDVYEPNTGDCITLQHPYCPDEHPEFDEAIGREIYSWVSMTQEEMEDEEDDESEV